MSGPTLLLLDGDGIGPEIVAATRHVLETANAAFALGLTFTTATIGFDALKESGTTIPDAVVEAALAADGVVLGPVSHNDYPPVAEGGLNPSGTLRKKLDLYANIRPAKTPPGVDATPVDLVTVRENTEGFYADRNMAEGPGEFMPEPGIALAIRKITSRASRRIADAAFRLAETRGAKHVTAVHKANVLRLSDGVFLAETRAVAAEHPGIRYDEVLIDAMAAHLVRDASRYDVIVTTNMYGDILSDLAAELSGSLGLAASLNAGETHAMAQAQHGSAPDIAGKGLANPASLIGSAAMLLHWLAERRGSDALAAAARAVDDGLAAALADASSRTPDLGGTAGTMDCAATVAARILAAGKAHAE
ncbi:isocitrate/isopropylmalate family dehydrogenase [Acuticoccus sp. MNP-M23]|uniref:isocitrate/isopropylmalate dehydrogenase family protein n=1 Tax=Acuticoccus sp. MNP-M23 TaxID=3072793 RepID=UPI002814DABB|nr:isocitrate/isopropylmalate family dehydrogenase [Acuticoccus sp. MNP-M23]WMS44452.1 isocitrate/isopropylmalate family dehydrogenase [Acuticoccus sp. MNP-M23]